MQGGRPNKLPHSTASRAHPPAFYAGPTERRMAGQGVGLPCVGRRSFGPWELGIWELVGWHVLGLELQGKRGKAREDLCCVLGERRICEIRNKTQVQGTWGLCAVIHAFPGRYSRYVWSLLGS